MSEIKEFIPLGGVLPDPVENAGKNWPFLGADDDWPIVNEVGDWGIYSSNPEKQATKRVDPFDCVSISLCGNVEKWLNKMMLEDPAVRPVLELLGMLGPDGKADISERFVAEGSGTIAGRGNSQYAVYEFVRKNGLVGEKMWPSHSEMTEDEFYSMLTPEIKKLGKKFCNDMKPTDPGYIEPYFTFNYKDVGESNDDLREALKRSPDCVVVGGAIIGNFNGALLYRNNGTPSYNHQLQGYRQDRNVEIWNEVFPVIHKIEDSYEPFLKDYAPNYPFKFAKIIKITLKKKVPMLYKKIGQSAICFKHWSQPSLIAFADGAIAGGDLFKSLFGVEKYSELPIQSVEEWPHPIKYHLTTNGLVSALED